MERYLSCYTRCDTGPWFLQSRPIPPIPQIVFDLPNNGNCMPILTRQRVYWRDRRWIFNAIHFKYEYMNILKIGGIHYLLQQLPHMVYIHIDFIGYLYIYIYQLFKKIHFRLNNFLHINHTWHNVPWVTGMQFFGKGGRVFKTWSYSLKLEIIE